MGVRLEVRSGWHGAAPSSATYQFDQTRIVIGRASTSDVWLPHPAVGRSHLTLQVKGVGYEATDDGSLNGTFINGNRITPNRPKRVGNGDVIEAGGFRIVLHLGVPIANGTTSVQTGELARQLYRALVTESDATVASFQAIEGPLLGERWELPAPPARLLIGRDPAAEIALKDEDVSREHAEISCDFRGYHLLDKGSKNGLWLGERQFMERWLQDGDEITIGESLLSFSDPLSRGMKGLELAPDEEAQPMAELNSPEAEEPPDEANPETTKTRPTPAFIHTGSEPSSEPSPPSRPRPSPLPAPSADALIFVFAGVLFAMSVIALIFLLK